MKILWSIIGWRRWHQNGRGLHNICMISCVSWRAKRGCIQRSVISYILYEHWSAWQNTFPGMNFNKFHRVSVDAGILFIEGGGWRGGHRRKVVNLAYTCWNNWIKYWKGLENIQTESIRMLAEARGIWRRLYICQRWRSRQRRWASQGGDTVFRLGKMNTKRLSPPSWTWWHMRKGYMWG